MRISAAERARWLRAAWLHDAFRDAARGHARPLGARGRAGTGSLRHGAASAARAAAEGETDRGMLDAVRYHSVGWAGWDMVGRVLYCADYLEPGRAFRREWRAEQAERFPDDPPASFSRWRATGWRISSSRDGRSSTHGAFLEQPRRALRIALIAALAVAIAGVVALMLPPEREHVAGHAYPYRHRDGGSGWKC